MLILLAWSVLAQGNLEREAQALVQKLGSESIEEREEAVRRLQRIGKPALPFLEKACGSPDPEVSVRARSLFRRIPILDRVTPHLLEVMPGLEDRLSLDDPHSWTEALQQAMELQVRQHLEKGEELFRPGDLEALGPLGVRGAATKQEKEWACSAVVHLGLGAAAPEVAKLLEDPLPEVRACARETLRSIESPLALPAFRQTLRDPEPNAQARACEYLADLRDRESVPEIARLLGSPSAFVRGQAACALARLGGEAYARAIGDLLGDPDPTARFYAIRAVAVLKVHEEGPRLRKLLGDADPEIRAHALQALEILEGPAALASLRALKDDPIPLVQRALTETLCHRGVPDRVPLALDADVRLDFLNGVRRPELWSRLRSLRIPEPFAGPVSELREKTEALAGLKVEWPPAALREEKEFSSALRYSLGRDRFLLPDLLPHLAGWDQWAILESDRIRFLPAADAKKFWVEWWASEKAKRK